MTQPPHNLRGHAYGDPLAHLLTLLYHLHLTITAKNVILSGVKSVTLYDTGAVTLQDLSSQVSCPYPPSLSLLSFILSLSLSLDSISLKF